MNDTINLNGIPITVASAQEAEEADFVVCLDREAADRHFSDNVHTVCAMCERAIGHRPNAPKRPMKVCLPCAAQTAGATCQ